MTPGRAASIPRIGFIGGGQLGVPLAWSLARAGYRVVGVASRSQASARKLAERIAEARTYDTRNSWSAMLISSSAPCRTTKSNP